MSGDPYINYNATIQQVDMRACCADPTQLPVLDGYLPTLVTDPAVVPLIAAANAKANAPSVASLQAWAQAVLDGLEPYLPRALEDDWAARGYVPAIQRQQDILTCKSACRVIMRLAADADTTAVTLPALPLPLAGLPPL